MNPIDRLFALIVYRSLINECIVVLLIVYRSLIKETDSETHRLSDQTRIPCVTAGAHRGRDDVVPYVAH